MLERKFTTQKVVQAICYVSCLLAIWMVMASVDGSEFVGGRVTGPLFSLADGGLLAISVSLIVLFWLPRVSAILGLAASVLSVPIILYFIYPYAFQRILKGQWSVPARATFTWKPGPAFALLVILATLYVSARCLSARQGITALPTSD